MVSVWLKLRNVLIGRRPMMMSSSSLEDNFILVMFQIETICLKRMVFPENQFNCKQIQEAKYTKIRRNQFI